MIAMPAISPYTAAWCRPVTSAVGKSLSKLINTITPATAENTTPNAAGPMIGINRANPTTAPSGSAKPDKVAAAHAFHLEPSASRNGIATAMPSGML